MDLFANILTLLVITCGLLFSVAYAIAKIIEKIYQWKKEEFTKRQFWQTVVIAILIILIISGFVCGGM